jgi:Low-density lipoprotein receptor domain class A
LTTKKRAIVQHFTGENKPVAIALIPTKGEMFIALQSDDHSHIDRQLISGDLVNNDHHHVIETGLKIGNIDLAIDEYTKKIYWTNTANRMIEFSNFDGSDRRVFHNDTKRAPFSIAIVEDDIVWTSFASSTLQMKNKNGGMPARLTSFDMGYLKVSANVASSVILKSEHACRENNGGCSDICISHGLSDKICACETGSVFKDSNRKVCTKRLICDFKCKSGECIEAFKVCDLKSDCKDGSDELPEACKTKSCSIDEFKCDNGECVPIAQRCDQNLNCKDSSDEKNCEPKSIQRVKCKDHQIMCPNSNFCIDATQVCDGRKDCADGFDEFESTCKFNCPKGFFKCISGQCIPKEFECNTVIECADGSDEHADCCKYF